MCIRDRLYINGELKDSFPYSAPIAYGTEPLLIGQGSGGPYNWDGTIDEVLVYDRALSNNEISDLIKPKINMPSTVMHGTTLNMQLSSPAHVNKPYVLALSLGTSGIPLGGITIPLTADGIFFASLSTLISNGILVNSIGNLNNNGQSNVMLSIPNDPGLSILPPIYAAYVVFSDSTFNTPLAVSNAYSFDII